MKKIYVAYILCLLTATAAKAQFVVPNFGTTDTPDIVNQIIAGDTSKANKVVENEPEPKKVDQDVEQSETEVRKLELEAQKLNLEQEIKELRNKARTPEEDELLKLKTENLKIVALKEKLLLEKELDEMQKQNKGTQYPESALYGHQFFRNNAFKMFESTADVVATENYVIGTGDVVQLEVWGYRYWSKSYTVSESGSIDISGYQKIFVKGLTLKQARTIIGSRLGIGGNESSFAINITRPRMVSVTILGEVFNPGTYTFPATNSAFNALVSMGGPSNIGSVRNIYIKRDGKIRDSFDTYENFGNVLHQREVFLQNNDYIIVAPAVNIINVSGSVRRPGLYELKNGEGLLDLIEFAGGAYPNTYYNDVLVSRIKNNAYEVLSVNLDSLKRLKKDFILNGGESVTFKSIVADNQFAVLISGAVSVPGTYRVKKGMKLSTLIKNANGLTSDAYPDKGYLVRTQKDFTKTYITFSLIDILQKKVAGADIEVEDRDSIYIFRSTDIQKFNVVSIGGSVYKPLQTQYIKGLTLGDLLFMAGGLTEDADEKKGFIIRTNANYEKQLIPFIPEEIVKKQGYYNFEILPKDQVTIYSKEAFLRKYKLEVKGSVKSPREMEFSENTRVSDLVNVAGGLEKTAYTKRALVIQQDLKTGIKSAKTINLELALANPESSANILLGRNDVLQIFNLAELRTDFSVDIFGEVRRAGSFAYADQMSLQNLIDLAGGLEFIAAGTQVEIVRNLFLKDGAFQFLKPEVIVSKISDNLLLDSGLNNFILQPFDKVFIRKNPNFIPTNLVFIDGAVQYPGYYALTSQSEKLNSIFKRAGGFRSDAMIRGISISRVKRTGDTMEVVPNSTKAIRRKKSKFNVIVKAGDHITVPYSESLVYLSGDMNKGDKEIGAYFMRGKRAKFYIRNFGGGFTRTSDKKKVVVVHANGARVGTHNYILFKIYPKVKEGSKVVVNSKATGAGGKGINADAILNKLVTRATAVLTLIGLYRVATVR